MKILDIAIKDMVRSFRSLFGVVFMFGMPLLVTGMFYIMFGNVGSTGEISVPLTKVVVVNLDQPGEEFLAVMANFPSGMEADSLGQIIINVLKQPEFAELLEVSSASDAASARDAVDEQKAGVALIIPPDFSKNFSTPDSQTELELYVDPTLSLGPAILQSVLKQFMDSFSGAKIAVNLVMSTAMSTDAGLIGGFMQQYMADQPQGEALNSLMDVRAPNVTNEPENVMAAIVGSIMGGMIVFYAFYTGTATAQTILKEDEERTLPRLFTTPTPETIILGGKFLAVFLTVLVQVVVLLLASRLIFRIEWGKPLAVVAMALGTVVPASAFGIFVNSLLKSTRQGGVVFGGVLTMTGMLAMIPIFTGMNANRTAWMDVVPLVVPQGWSVRALFQSMNGAPANAILVTLLVVLTWSVVMLTIGVWRFQKRYA
jgi:ABC-2 type transport system permease protein